VGAGSSQEAPFALRTSVPAGTYHLVLDAIIITPVDVTFDLVWRHADGSADTVLVEWTEHYTPLGGGNFDAQPFEYDEPTTTAIDEEKGDELVFRYTASATSQPAAYVPNGDGATANGRFPNITLPKK
jgi:hypothetical protein